MPAVQEKPAKTTKSTKSPKSPRPEKQAAQAVLPSAPLSQNDALPKSVTLALLPEVAAAFHAEAQKRGTTLEAVALDALHRGLRQFNLSPAYQMAQFERMGLVPKNPLPPGKTIKDVLDELRENLPPDEDDPYTDEDYLRILEKD